MSDAEYDLARLVHVDDVRAAAVDYRRQRDEVQATATTDSPDTTGAARVVKPETWPPPPAVPDASPCTCAWAYLLLGRLYGISMGKGWQRTTTPGCPVHGGVTP